MEDKSHVRGAFATALKGQDPIFVFSLIYARQERLFRNWCQHPTQVERRIATPCSELVNLDSLE